MLALFYRFRFQFSFFFSNGFVLHFKYSFGGDVFVLKLRRENTKELRSNF